jgi:hypothetical protein
MTESKMSLIQLLLQVDHDKPYLYGKWGGRRTTIHDWHTLPSWERAAKEKKSKLQGEHGEKKFVKP